MPTNFGFSLFINGKPDYVRKCRQTTRQRLGIVRAIDLWYCIDLTGDAIEDTVGAMAEAVKAASVTQVWSNVRERL